MLGFSDHELGFFDRSWFCSTVTCVFSTGVVNSRPLLGFFDRELCLLDHDLFFLVLQVGNIRLLVWFLRPIHVLTICATGACTYAK